MPRPADSRRPPNARPGRRAAAVYDAAGLADALRLPRRAVEALLGRARSFFPHAWQGDDGAWQVPERDVVAYLGRQRATLPLVTLEEAADLLRVSRRTVERLLDAGELTSVRVKGSFRSVRIVLDDVAALVESDPKR